MHGIKLCDTLRKDKYGNPCGESKCELEKGGRIIYIAQICELY